MPFYSSVVAQISKPDRQTQIAAINANGKQLSRKQLESTLRNGIIGSREALLSTSFMDRNKDGVLSGSEVKGVYSRFPDFNRDRRLSLREVRQWIDIVDTVRKKREAFHAATRRASLADDPVKVDGTPCYWPYNGSVMGTAEVDRRFAELDRDNDDSLKFDEVSGTRLYRVQDYNRDGRLTLLEVKRFERHALQRHKQWVDCADHAWRAIRGLRSQRQRHCPS